MSNSPVQNTDVEIWRQDLKDPLDPGNFYAPSVHVTVGNSIGINVNGTVVVMPPDAWINLYLSSQVKLSPWRTGNPPEPGWYIATKKSVLGSHYSGPVFWNGMVWLDPDYTPDGHMEAATETITAWMPLPEPYQGVN